MNVSGAVGSAGGIAIPLFHTGLGFLAQIVTNLGHLLVVILEVLIECSPDLLAEFFMGSFKDLLSSIEFLFELLLSRLGELCPSQGASVVVCALSIVDIG